MYLGEQVDGIRAELDALSPDWRTTVRVVHGPSGALVGASLVEWDEELGRAWVHGPVGRRRRRRLGAVGPTAVRCRGRPDPAGDRQPWRCRGRSANTRLAALADDLGWTPTVTNFAYVLDAATAAEWPSAPDDAGLRVVVADDLAAIEPLHEAEFPASYFSAAQLLARAAAGEQVVLVAEDDRGRAGRLRRRSGAARRGGLHRLRRRRPVGTRRRRRPPARRRCRPAAAPDHDDRAGEPHRAGAAGAGAGAVLVAGVPRGRRRSGATAPDSTAERSVGQQLLGNGPTGGSSRRSSARGRPPCARRTSAGRGGCR